MIWPESNPTKRGCEDAAFTPEPAASTLLSVFKVFIKILLQLFKMSVGEQIRLFLIIIQLFHAIMKFQVTKPIRNPLRLKRQETALQRISTSQLLKNRAIFIQVPRKCYTKFETNRKIVLCIVFICFLPNEVGWPTVQTRVRSAQKIEKLVLEYFGVKNSTNENLGVLKHAQEQFSISHQHRDYCRKDQARLSLPQSIQQCRAET